jgi:NAD(P)-dependent dehydrogenase (short-subunit alcohol dehydrogenase family)
VSSSAPRSPSALFDLTDRVALVTGASSGLGHRFARVLHEAGAIVVAVARRADRLADLARTHDRIVARTVDVADDGHVRLLVDEVVAEHGRIDVVVNNAGLGNPARALEADLDDFRYTLEVNVVALFNLSRLAARPMLAAGSGSIINIGSIFGLGSSWPIPNPAYTASKGAVSQLTRELACQWAKGGVRVNAIAPGFFPSELTAGLETDAKSLAYIERGTPMRRMGQEHELDGALLFLAGEASTFVTGQTLVVDGGWTAH